MKFKLKEFVKIYGDYDVEFTVVGSETGAVEFIKLSKPKPKPTLTEDEKVILRNVKLKQIARDSYGNLLCGDDLTRSGNGWYQNVYDYTYLLAFNHLFKFVSWEDEEPYNIKELLDE